MKKFSYLLTLFIILPILLNGQTVIRFQSEKYSKNSKSISSHEGTVTQIGKEFSGKLRVELPEKTLELDLKMSRLKQYDKVFTSEGEIQSKVEIYEDINQKGAYFVAVIDKKFYSLSILENEDYFSLEKQKNEQFIYQKNEIGESNNLDFNDYYLPKNDNSKDSENKKSRRFAVSGCLEFPIGFICDYEHFRQKQKPVSEIEADNLILLATSQEVWSKNSFDGDIKFKTIGQLIYTNPTQMPWDTDVNLGLNNIWSELSNSWKNIESWRKYNLLTKVGLTGINYGKSNNWGWGGGLQRDYSMGTVVMKSFLNKNQLKWLFAHELGHVFGASHDNTNFVMNPTYESASLYWSSDSKSSVNNVLNKLNSSNWLNSCHTLSVEWAFANDSLSFNWQTNLDSIDDTFSLEYSNDNRETWNTLATKKSNANFKYQLNIPNKLNSNNPNYFRISQQGKNIIISDYITIIITEIEENLPNKTISVFPNPFDNYLKINTLSLNEIKIYDVSGRLIKQFNQNEKQLLIDTSLWKIGNYFIQIGNVPNEVFKVLKQY